MKTVENQKKRVKAFMRVGLIMAYLFFLLSVISVAIVGSVAVLPETIPMRLRHHNSSISNGYTWISLEHVPGNFLESVWVAEDERFFKHNGFDWIEIKKAWQESKRTGKPARGASTITQQCARSVFLWQGRSWIRKGLEAYYTILMELMLSKRRILELYVNVIELGDGVYGIEAAAQHYYKKQAKDLTREEAAMLVAIMPRPREWNPLHPSEQVLTRYDVVLHASANVALPIDLKREKE